MHPGFFSRRAGFGPREFTTYQASLHRVLCALLLWIPECHEGDDRSLLNAPLSHTSPLLSNPLIHRRFASLCRPILTKPFLLPSFEALSGWGSVKLTLTE